MLGSVHQEPLGTKLCCGGGFKRTCPSLGPCQEGESSISGIYEGPPSVHLAMPMSCLCRACSHTSSKDSFARSRFQGISLANNQLAQQRPPVHPNIAINPKP